mmetsp:Transcript_13060/g.33727  ORF Transcript_13060/g.33727 Transcript_13060/m.33727 type:complete len:212 (-) Transcript_13060:95-730(-)
MPCTSLAREVHLAARESLSASNRSMNSRCRAMVRLLSCCWRSSWLAARASACSTHCAACARVSSSCSSSCSPRPAASSICCCSAAIFRLMPSNTLAASCAGSSAPPALPGLATTVAVRDASSASAMAPSRQPRSGSSRPPPPPAASPSSIWSRNDIISASFCADCLTVAIGNPRGPTDARTGVVSIASASPGNDLAATGLAGFATGGGGGA